MTYDLIDCDLWIAMNEDGGWVVVCDESDALTELGEQQGGSVARVVKVVVKMTPPKMAEVSVTVPDDAGSQEAVAA